MNILPILKGMATYVPGASIVYMSRRHAGNSASARYCYSAWLRHLVNAYEHGLSSLPETLAELGPGASLGIGCASLLSGVNTYFGFDVVHYGSSDRNLAVFEELVQLFSQKAAIPDDTEFSRLKPSLRVFSFPGRILTDDLLSRTLEPSRLDAIRLALREPGKRHGEILVDYIVPWHSAEFIRPDVVDMIISQAVMEHIDDLPFAYETMRLWLKPGGLVSHQVDYRSHGITRAWNGHWEYPNTVWKIVRGRRPYLINRVPHSHQVRYLNDTGFTLTNEIRVFQDDGIERSRLASEFAGMSDDDFRTSSGFIQARKPAR